MARESLVRIYKLIDKLVKEVNPLTNKLDELLETARIKIDFNEELLKLNRRKQKCE